MKTRLIHLPGLKNQYDFLVSKVNLNGLNALIIGNNSHTIAELLFNENSCMVEIIVENYESLLITQMHLENFKSIPVKFMDFESTDYNTNMFDLVFAQGSISDIRQKNIVKEIKRILKPNGFFCIGEVVKLEKEIPTFVKDIFESSNLAPLYKNEIEKYFTDKNFTLIDSIDLSHTFTEYYKTSSELLKESIMNFSSNEKSYYKKLLNKISHESNAYLKLGAKNYIGFMALLLKKK